MVKFFHRISPGTPGEGRVRALSEKGDARTVAALVSAAYRTIAKKGCETDRVGTSNPARSPRSVTCGICLENQSRPFLGSFRENLKFLRLRVAPLRSFFQGLRAHLPLPQVVGESTGASRRHNIAPQSVSGEAKCRKPDSRSLGFWEWQRSESALPGRERARADILTISGSREDSGSSELRINNTTQSSSTPPAIDNFTTSVNFNNTNNGTVSVSNGSATGTASQNTNAPLVGTTGTSVSGSGGAGFQFNVPSSPSNSSATAGGEATFDLNFQVTEAQDFGMSAFIVNGGGTITNTFVALYDHSNSSTPFYDSIGGNQQSTILLQPGVNYELFAEVLLEDSVDLPADFGRTDEFTFNLTPNGPPLSSPEPATLTMLCTGFLAIGGIAVRRWRRRPPNSNA